MTASTLVSIKRNEEFKEKYKDEAENNIKICKKTHLG